MCHTEAMASENGAQLLIYVAIPVRTDRIPRIVGSGGSVWLGTRSWMRNALSIYWLFGVEKQSAGYDKALPEILATRRRKSREVLVCLSFISGKTATNTTLTLLLERDKK